MLCKGQASVSTLSLRIITSLLQLLLLLPVITYFNLQNLQMRSNPQQGGRLMMGRVDTTSHLIGCWAEMGPDGPVDVNVYTARKVT